MKQAPKTPFTLPGKWWVGRREKKDSNNSKRRILRQEEWDFPGKCKVSSTPLVLLSLKLEFLGLQPNCMFLNLPFVLGLISAQMLVGPRTGTEEVLM